MEKLITNNSQFELDLSDFTSFFQQLYNIYSKHISEIEEKLNVTPGNINIEYLEYINRNKDDQVIISNNGIKELIKSINIDKKVIKDLDETLDFIQELLTADHDITSYEMYENLDFLELFKSINVLRKISTKDETVTFDDIIHCHYITDNSIFKSIFKVPEKKEVSKRI